MPAALGFLGGVFSFGAAGFSAAAGLGTAGALGYWAGPVFGPCTFGNIVQDRCQDRSISRILTVLPCPNIAPPKRRGGDPIRR